MPEINNCAINAARAHCQRAAAAAASTARRHLSHCDSVSILGGEDVDSAADGPRFNMSLCCFMHHESSFRAVISRQFGFYRPAHIYDAAPGGPLLLMLITPMITAMMMMMMMMMKAKHGFDDGNHVTRSFYTWHRTAGRRLDGAMVWVANTKPFCTANVLADRSVVSIRISSIGCTNVEPSHTLGSRPLNAVLMARQ
jgi:hypothetical protein